MLFASIIAEFDCFLDCTELAFLDPSKWFFLQLEARLFRMVGDLRELSRMRECIYITDKSK
jgi:hypothetical protein